MQQTPPMVADFLQRLAIFESDVAGNYMLYGLGHNQILHATERGRIKSKIFPVCQVIPLARCGNLRRHSPVTFRGSGIHSGNSCSASCDFAANIAEPRCRRPTASGKIAVRLACTPVAPAGCPYGPEPMTMTLRSKTRWRRALVGASIISMNLYLDQSRDKAATVAQFLRVLFDVPGARKMWP
jgi:hypothetical protein